MDTSHQVTGADLLIQTAAASGIEVCFANAGTTEIDLVDALTRAGSIRTVLCLFEGVCSGAADGYARMAGRPAIGLYHLGPGFANSLANQHNARRNRAPMINLIGDQASWHLPLDAPLTSEIGALTGWAGLTRRVVGADDACAAMSFAVGESTRGAGQIVSLIVPTDSAWGPTSLTPESVPFSGPEPLDTEAVAAAARALLRPGSGLIVGGIAVSERSMRLLGRIRLATGCRLLTNRPTRTAIGRHLPAIDELAYLPEPKAAALTDLENVVLAGSSEPITFFGYDGVEPRSLPPGTDTVPLCGPDAALDEALSALADALGATEDEPITATPLPPIEGDELTVRTFGAVLARSIPEGAIVVNEGLTSSAAYRHLAHSCAPHTLVSILGGAIGGGLPTSLGAAIARPDAPIIALQADGSALYTIQSLWTMARESLDVTVVIAANQKYNIIEVEFARSGLDLEDPVARSLVDLTHPSIDFVELASGFGVPAVRATTGPEAARAIQDALAEPGPHLIEVLLR